MQTLDDVVSADVTMLAEIPVIDTGSDFAMATLEAFPSHVAELIAGATKHIPRQALRAADAISRRWLVKSGHAALDEIDTIAAKVGRPGAYFLSVNYEWGCTVGVRASGDEGGELIRVLDWRTPGLGRYVIAARVDAEPGPFVTMTWPGYTGVLQAMAPGRFAGAINQAPMPRRGGGFMPLDWLMNKVDVWHTRGITPAHLMRDIFETAATFAEARARLIEVPVAAPVIFSLVGCGPGELCIIERQGANAHVHTGVRAAANAWLAPQWHGRARGADSPGRTRQMLELQDGNVDDFGWLRPPIRNSLTRLAMVARPASGRLIAQGFEAEGPVTQVLRWRHAGLS